LGRGICGTIHPLVEWLGATMITEGGPLRGLRSEGIRPRRNVSSDPGSRLLHALDRWTTHPTVAWTIVVTDAAGAACIAIFGFPDRWAAVFQTIVAAITVAMVFVIQHTQAREQAVTQRKLDEILSALPGANNAMITLEEAQDDDLRAAAQIHRDLRDAATAGPPPTDSRGSVTR